MDGRVAKLRKKFEESLKQTAEVAGELQRAEGGTTAIPRYIEIEAAAHEAGQQLSRRIQACSVGEVATGAALHAACPGCGRLCRLSARKRRLESTDGPVEVLEPVGRCDRCRRSFFPSAQGPGAG
jgi:hypothetical protein